MKNTGERVWCPICGKDMVTKEEIKDLVFEEITKLSCQHIIGIWKRLRTPAADWEMPVWEMGLSTRAKNCLLRSGYETLGDVLSIQSEGELFGLKNLGRKALYEIRMRVHELGFKMAWEE